MRKACIAASFLLSINALGQPTYNDFIDHQFERWLTAPENTMAPFNTINLPDVATVPDGTTATALNTGLSLLSGTCTIESYTGHPTYPDGTRYIRSLKGNSLLIRIDDDVDIDNTNYYGYEFGISYHLMDGASVPTDENDAVISMVQSGTQLRVNHRARSAIDGIDFFTDLFSTTATGKEEVDADGMRILRFGDSYRIGFGLFRNAAGYVISTIDGHVNSINAQAQTSFLTSAANFGRFTRLVSADIEAHLVGPFRTWNTSAMETELPVPDRDDELLGSARYMMRQIHKDVGPFTPSGAGTVTWPDYSTGGISSLRHRAVTAGGAVTLTLKSEHAIETLPTRAGYSAIRLMDNYNPGTNQTRIQIGDDDVSDIVDVTFDGDDGFKVKLGGTATGLVYNATDRWELVMLMGPAGSPEALILNNITNTTQGDNRLQVAAWDRGIETGIPSLNSMTVTCFDAATEFGEVWATPGFDLVLASSFVHTSETDPSPDLGAQNHLSKYMDGFGDGRYLRSSRGIFGANPFGRSGHPLTAMDEAANQYADFDKMGAGLHVWCVEWVVNDAADYDDVVDEMTLLIDACYDAGNWLTVIESQYQPDNVGASIDSAWRARQDLINAEVKRLLMAKNAGPRFRWIAINGGRTAAEIETAYFTGGDNLHPAGTGTTIEDAAGSELFMLDVYSATPLVSLGGNRSRDRNRGR